MMLYLKTDVLLSVDVFEKLRDNCLEYYEIDPCYAYSTPGLTWLCGLLIFMIQHNMVIEVG